MPIIHVEPIDKRIETRTCGETLLEILNRGNIPIESTCGGRGSCSNCKIIVKRGSAPVGEVDREHLSQEELDSGMRLACQLEVTDDMEIEIPDEFFRGEQVILEDSLSDLEIDPVIEMNKVVVQEPSLEYQVSDFERLIEALGNETSTMNIGLSLLRELPEILRSNSEVGVVSKNSEILDLPVQGVHGIYGVAIDIGTTTIVGYLLDLENGAHLSIRSIMNPQIKYGDDVVSRITFTMERKDGTSILQDTIVECVDDLIGDLCSSASVPRERVYEVVIAGNTAMHHLFFGLDTKQLTLSPYIPVTCSSMDARASELGIKINEEGYVCSLPNVAGFVGADHVAALLTCELEESELPSLVIDIGTNGEISLITEQGIVSTSCAAGPAFEGANLRCGMRATEGVIDSISISDDLEVHYETIGGLPPIGLCGSGVVDAISEMVRTGVVDSSGRICREIGSSRIRMSGGELEFILVWEDESESGRVISLNQNDIEQIQYAKAALYVGASTLMDRCGVKPHELKSILLAGAFGNYLSTGNAINLGIFPEVPLDRIRSVGNAAGTGCKMALLSLDRRERAKELVKEIEYLELAAQPDFENEFYQAMFIPHRDLSLFPTVTKRLELDRSDHGE